MRITSGYLRNRCFSVPNDEVRPTMGAVREAVFSSLGGNCEGLKVLDLFAGSGALGMEAWSRGADSVTFVEQSSNVWKNLLKNIESLESDELGKTKVFKSDAVRWLSRAGTQFDLILADPPYDLPNAMENTLEGIVTHSVLKADGILVYEMRVKGDPVVSNDWNIIRDKKYGKTRVLILKLKSEDK